MSQHQAFRRQAVPQQVAQSLQSTTLPAPLRGLRLDENQAFMTQGGALVLDNWLPTLRGVKLRGGYIRWATPPEATPIYSGFEYTHEGVERMYVGNATKLYDVTAGGTPTLIKDSQTSGIYTAAQLANAAGDWMIVVNDNGDYPLRFDGGTWETLNPGYTPPGGKPSKITGPVGSTVVNGGNLSYVWKYRNRLFFIENGSMNAYYLGIDSAGGVLSAIPLSGAATQGGYLLFGAVWSLDSGDGLDDKCCFVTSEGEVLIFTGSNPADPNNWRQEGRYQVSKPLGQNAHINIGGDLLIATIDGIVPVSAAVSKDVMALQLSAITKALGPMWQTEANTRNTLPWSMHKWPEFGGLFVTLPGGTPGNQRCLAANLNTGAWCRITGWDAMCFMQMRKDMFFGTQIGVVMQADRTGYDDGKPYVATMVGGWEMFQSPSQTVTWRQARAIFTSGPNEPFIPQISAVTDYALALPTPPLAGIDPGGGDYWDQGHWDISKWDQGVTVNNAATNTGWVSVGQTGFTHAPVLQVTVAQEARPQVELISITATFERGGVNV